MVVIKEFYVYESNFIRLSDLILRTILSILVEPSYKMVSSNFLLLLSSETLFTKTGSWNLRTF